MGEFYRMTRKRLRRQVVEFVDVQGFDDPQHEMGEEILASYLYQVAPLSVVGKERIWLPFDGWRLMMPFHSKAEAANLRPTQFLRTTSVASFKRFDY